MALDTFLFYFSFFSKYFNDKTKNLYDIRYIHISVNSMVHIKTKV